MNTHADQTQENKSQAVSAVDSQIQSGGESTFQFVDNRPEAVAQRKLQEMAYNSPRAMKLKAFQDVAKNSPQAKQTAQLQSMADNSSYQQQQPIQKKENNTGLPDNLKTGMENLSGMSLDDVKVHRNSDKPAQLQAHAYAQGTDIHLGPRQEKHLPHEAWHVVQQKQGRVKPTVQMKGKVNVNDDAGLEKEADIMGAKAISYNNESSPEVQKTRAQGSIIQRELMKEDEFLNISDSFFSGSRNRVLKVDEALKKCQGASSKSMALTELIGACNEYLNIPEQKATKRISGVEALLKNATEELASWRLRERIPLPNAVYRMDERAPEEIANVGFQPWNAGGEISIIEHVNQVLEVDREDAPTGESGKAGKGAKKHSQWVSTSGDLNFAKDPTLLQGLLSKYFYKIDTTVDPKKFTNVNKHFDEQGVPNPYEPQFEFIKSGGIPGNQVTYYVHGRELMEFVIAGTDASSWNIQWTPMPVQA